MTLLVLLLTLSLGGGSELLLGGMGNALTRREKGRRIPRGGSWDVELFILGILGHMARDLLPLRNGLLKIAIRGRTLRLGHVSAETIGIGRLLPVGGMKLRLKFVAMRGVSKRKTTINGLMNIAGLLSLLLRLIVVVSLRPMRDWLPERGLMGSLRHGARGGAGPSIFGVILVGAVVQVSLGVGRGQMLAHMPRGSSSEAVGGVGVVISVVLGSMGVEVERRVGELLLPGPGEGIRSPIPHAAIVALVHRCHDCSDEAEKGVSRDRLCLPVVSSLNVPSCCRRDPIAAYGPMVVPSWIDDAASWAQRNSKW